MIDGLSAAAECAKGAHGFVRSSVLPLSHLGLWQACGWHALQETEFCSTGATNELFASTHIDERLPLQRISALCTVDMSVGSIRGARAASTADYFCTYLYNHREENLSKLPTM